MTTTLGPYRFSDTDVRRTLDNALVLLDLMPAAGHDALGPRRARVATALEGLDLRHGDQAALDAALAQVWPELLEARSDLVAAGALPATATGTVSHLARSDGGVPKAGVDQVEVGFGGVAGDRQASRKHHGRPWQALCLWSTEVLDALAAEGHPIGPGSAGENVTITGLPWARVEPGTRLRLGTVLCQISAYAIPCQQNARWFSDGRFDRIHHKQGPISRTYATVLEPGIISLGDPAVLEPA